MNYGDAIRKPHCEAGPAIEANCFHGNTRRIKVPCGDIGRCAYCLEAWRKRVRQRIWHGIESNEGAPWRVATFTICPHTHRVKNICIWCGAYAEAPVPADGSLELGLEAWKHFRKWLWRVHGGAKVFRVFELNEKGYLHCHVVTDANLPRYIGPSEAKLSLGAWYESLGTAANVFVSALIGFGWGPVSDCKRLRSGAGGAAKYLSKYLTKADAKGLRRADGRRIRVAEGSRNWYTNPHKKPYLWTAGKKVHGDIVELVPSCKCPEPKTRYPNQGLDTWEHARRDASDHWTIQSGLYRDDVIRLIQRLSARRKEVARRGSASPEATWASWAVKIQKAEMTAKGCEVPIGWIWEHRKEFLDGYQSSSAHGGLVATS